MSNKFRAVLHGSFSKHFDKVKHVYKVFSKAGIEVIAPKDSEIAAFEGGFALFEGEQDMDPRLVELLYLHNLKQLGDSGFSYFVNPDGYIGKSASYELGIAQVTNIRCFFMSRLDDHPAYLHSNSIWEPEDLVEYIQEFRSLPLPMVKRSESMIHKLWLDLMVPGSVVAAGAIIEYESSVKEKEILLVKTYKWGGRYSMVGGKVKRGELLKNALFREVKEETGLNSRVGAHICTFDQIKNSGYYKVGTQHIFVDNVVAVASKKVCLNDEAEDFVWIKAREALKHLKIEPNARKTLEFYLRLEDRQF